ncbi:permease-like cell division protein FtsX [Actinoplanes sp. HUAS TT8]|uniref:permease-like cell division protein FtsX n=1 Tax=Actinoplanes sp. HUAS TT8 TaxID=3447453 RepID=UPI003F51EA3B
MRVKYVLNEVLVGLWRNVTMTIAMIITITVSLGMLGASVLMYLQVDRMKTFYYGEIEVSIFLVDNVSEGQITALEEKLKSNPLVKTATHETKQDALERFKVLYADSPDFVAAVNADSLPESFRVKLNNPEDYDKFNASLGDQQSQGIQRVIDQRELLQKVFNIFNSVQLMSLVFAVVMAGAAVLLVGNTIQVAAYSKRREVAVMKLVGASNWFVQAPFVLEAVVAGAIGAILGFVGLFIGKVVLLDNKLQALTAILTPVPNGNVWLMLPLLVGVGAVVSAATAWVTLRFYLKV